MASSEAGVYDSHETDSCRYERHGCSTAQMRLKRIIGIISAGLDWSSRELRKVAANQEPPRAESGAGVAAAQARDFLTGFGIDLNLRLGPTGEVLVRDDLAAAAAAAEGDSSVCSAGEDGRKPSGGGLSSSVESGDVSAAAKSSVGECDPKPVVNLSEKTTAKDVNRVGEANEVKGREFSEITNVEGEARRNDSDRVRDRGLEPGGSQDSDSSPITSCRNDEELEEGDDAGRNNRKADGNGRSGGGYLHLLLEAVRRVSGSFEDEQPEPPPAAEPEEKAADGADAAVPEPSTRCRSARKREWWLDFYGAFEDDTAPVVRSKRGRNQILPSRYRDSVLEPWGPLPRHRR